MSAHAPDRQTRHVFILALWVALICCVVIGSLLPAKSPVMNALDRLDISDKAMHFGAYLALSLLPVIGFQNRRKGIVAGISMFALSMLLEAGQYFAPGRGVELADLFANAAGVSCGTLLGMPVRAGLAIW